MIALRRLGLDDVLVAVTFALSFLLSYRPGVPRMALPGAVAASVGAAAAVWASGRRPAASIALVVLLALGLPLVNTVFGAMDLVVVLAVFRAAAGSPVPLWAVTAASTVALTANAAWERVAAGDPVGLPTVVHPLLLTALAVGLGRQTGRVRVQHAELAALRDAAAFTGETASAALDARRQVVRVLDTDGAAPLAPQPGLADIDAVVARAWLEVARRDGALRVTIEDDGPGTWRGGGAAGRTGGSGLVGMRERAEACGGHLDVGPSTRGGWRVASVLPTGEG